MALNRWRHHKGTDHWESQRKSKEKRQIKKETGIPRQKRLWERIGSREAESRWWNVSVQCNTDIVSKNNHEGHRRHSCLPISSSQWRLQCWFSLDSVKTKIKVQPVMKIVPGYILEKQLSRLEDPFDCKKKQIPINYMWSSWRWLNAKTITALFFNIFN